MSDKLKFFLRNWKGGVGVCKRYRYMVCILYFCILIEFKMFLDKCLNCDVFVWIKKMFKNGGCWGLMFMLGVFCGVEVRNVIDIYSFVFFFKVE